MGCDKPAPTVLPILGSRTQVSCPPRQNAGQSVPGRSDPRPFSLLGGRSALQRWPGTRGGVGAAGGADAPPPRVWVSVEALSETAVPVEAPRSPQSGTPGQAVAPERLSAPQFPPPGWLARPFHQGPSTTTGSEICGRVQTPRKPTRTCVCASYGGYSTSGFLPQRKQFQRGLSQLARVRVAESTARGAHASTHTSPVPPPRGGRPRKGTCPPAHGRAARRALKSRGGSRRASLSQESTAQPGARQHPPGTRNTRNKSS